MLTITDDLKSIDKNLKKKVKRSIKDLLKKSSYKSSYIVSLTSNSTLSDLQHVELLTIVSILTIANAFHCYATKEEINSFKQANHGKCMVVKDEIISIPEDEKKQIKAINDNKDEMKKVINKATSRTNIQYLQRIDANNSSRRINTTQNPDFTFDQLDKRIRVFVLDSGIAIHSNLNINSALSRNFTSNNPRDFVDRNGHGTHVAGTVGAVINAQFNNSGVAPNIEVIAYKVMADNGTGSRSDIFNGLESVDQYKRRNPDEICIVNMSLGGPRNRRMDGNGNVVNDSGFENYARRINNLIDSGVIVVVAAGNSNVDAVNRLPAALPEVITVGAYDSTTNRIALFSNHGPSVDIMAPGVSINNTWWNPVNSFSSISGTSMAAPVVTGAIVNMIAVALKNKTGKLVEAGAAAEAKLQNVIKEILQEDARQSNLQNLNPLIMNNVGISYPQNTTNLGVYIGSYVQNGTTIANY